MMIQRMIAALAALTVLGCVDSKSSQADGSAARQQTEAQHVDMIHLDTAAAQGQSPAIAPGAPPPVTDSSRTRDPMPPLAGETNPRSGRMKPAEPVLRDSAAGPRIQLDSTGRPVRIKR